jgi:hypothetical protein
VDTRIRDLREEKSSRQSPPEDKIPDGAGGWQILHPLTEENPPGIPGVLAGLERDPAGGHLGTNDKRAGTTWGPVSSDLLQRIIIFSFILLLFGSDLVLFSLLNGD